MKDNPKGPNTKPDQILPIIAGVIDTRPAMKKALEFCKKKKRNQTKSEGDEKSL